MKNSTKPHGGSNGKEHRAAKDEKPASEHGHAHANDKAEKDLTPIRPAPAETGRSADKPADSSAEGKLASLEERHLRLLADFDNYRKRSLRDKETAARLERENMLLEFLPVIDSLELGINAALAQKMDQAFVDGYRMIVNQLSDALAKFGLTPLDAQGKQFDPNRHEAVHQVTSEEYPAGTVLAVVRKGYLSGDVVLRPARVVVSSGSAVEASTSEEAVEEPAVELNEEAIED